LERVGGDSAPLEAALPPRVRYREPRWTWSRKRRSASGSARRRGPAGPPPARVSVHTGPALGGVHCRDPHSSVPIDRRAAAGADQHSEGTTVALSTAWALPRRAQELAAEAVPS